MRLFITALLLLMSVQVNGALISRLGGLAYYDDVLNITWLANANLASSNTFGITGVNANGSMDLSVAKNWVSAMNAANFLNVNAWRMPALSPINGINFESIYSNNGTTDDGYGSWGAFSEMGFMFYENLGNLGYCLPNGSGSAVSCDIQTDWGLKNTGLFDNIQPGSSEHYWTEIESPFPGTFHVWGFDFSRGRQAQFVPDNDFFVWAVHDGDIGAVPEPPAILLFGAGLLGLVIFRKKVTRA